MLTKISQRIAQYRADILPGEHDRDLADRKRGGSDAIDDETCRREFFAVLHREFRIRLRAIDDRWHQQGLARAVTQIDRGLQALVENALVRRVHVDKRDAVRRLRHDVDAMQLGHRVTEWRVRRAGSLFADCSCVPR